MANIHIPPVSRICQGVIRILGLNPGPMTLQGTNTYLLGSGKRRILVDAGENGNGQYIAKLKTVLDEEQASLDHIVITHWHHDHIGGVEDILQEISDVPVWKFPRSDGDEATGIPLKYLKDGDEIKAESVMLKVVHTPGHTTDHVILMDGSSGTMFSGDTVLGTGTAVFDDLYTYMKSLEKMLALRPKLILPGHGPVIEDPMTAIKYYIEHRNKREADILSVLLQHCDVKMTAMEIVKILYADIDHKLWTAASVNVTRHLEKLVKDRKVIATGALWQLCNPGSSL